MTTKKKILGIFDRRPLIWFHYVLLTGIVLTFLFFLNVFNVKGNFDEFLWFAFFLFIVISISDQIIHAVLGVN